jgi:replicative DNA helicase
MTEKSHETAERAIVGSLLLRPFEYHSIGALTHKEFALPDCRRAYQAIERLWADGVTPGVVAIVDWTESEKGRALPFEEVDGITRYTTNCIELGRAVEIVRQAALDRRVRLAAQALAQSPKRGEKLLSEAMTAFNGLGAGDDDGAILLTHAIRDVTIKAEQLEKGEGAEFIISTGVAGVDAKVHMERGGVLVVAGRPSMGKSALMLWLVDQWAKRGERILMFTTETGASGVARRFLAMETKLNSRSFGYGNDSNETWSRVTSGAAALHGHPVWIDDQSDNGADIARRIRYHRQRDGITIVVIDHIQECIPGDDPRKEINQLIASVRSACREAPRIGLVLVSQLARRVESRDNRIPIMSDLKESGKIEETADSVLLAFRPSYYAKDCKRYKDHSQDEMWLSVAKNRDGATGWLKMSWDSARGQVRGVLDERNCHEV